MLQDRERPPIEPARPRRPRRRLFRRNREVGDSPSRRRARICQPISATGAAMSISAMAETDQLNEVGSTFVVSPDEGCAAHRP
jgi:hypothetical protein